MLITMIAYTIEFALTDHYVIEHVTASDVPAVCAAIEKADGHVKHIVAEKERI